MRSKTPQRQENATPLAVQQRDSVLARQQHTNNVHTTTILSHGRRHGKGHYAYAALFHPHSREISTVIMLPVPAQCGRNSTKPFQTILFKLGSICYETQNFWRCLNGTPLAAFKAIRPKMELNPNLKRGWLSFPWRHTHKTWYPFPCIYFLHNTQLSLSKNVVTNHGTFFCPERCLLISN